VYLNQRYQNDEIDAVFAKVLSKEKPEIVRIFSTSSIPTRKHANTQTRKHANTQTRTQPTNHKNSFTMTYVLRYGTP
jgi:hypothetical protein